MYKPDNIDWKIITFLNENGRMPSAEIARKLGNVSARTVTNRINALTENGIISVRAIVDPVKVGYGVMADVFIEVEPHEFFSRNNTDVVCQIEISFVQAALGDKIKVKTLNGQKGLEIPKGTQPGDIFRMPGEGIPSLRGNRRGDQIIQVLIKTPTHLSKKQVELLREFENLESAKLSKIIKDILKGGQARAK